MIGQVTSLVERSIRQLLVDNFGQEATERIRPEFSVIRLPSGGYRVGFQIDVTGDAAARLEQLAAEFAIESALH